MGAPKLQPSRQHPIDPAKIPAELRGFDRWVCWRFTDRKGVITKVPFQARGKGAIRDTASSTDPATWSSFTEAMAAQSDPANQLDGVGFVFAEEGPYAGVDFDACLDPDGSVLPWAKPWLDRLVGYAEVSPSGRGVKLFIRGEVPSGKGRKLTKCGPGGLGAVEVYDRGRFFTVTSRQLDKGHALVGAGGEVLTTLHAEWFPRKARTPQPRKPARLTRSDHEIIAQIERSEQGQKFSALWNGSTDGHHSGSEADLALCSILAWWLGGDVTAVDRLFRQSGLYREDKWDRPSYREPTVDKACNLTSFYDPNFGRAKIYDPTGVEQTPTTLPTEEGSGDGTVAPMKTNEADDDPHRLARVHLDAKYRHPDQTTLVYHNGEFHRWDTAYRPVPIQAIRAALTVSTKAEFDRINLRDIETWQAAKGNRSKPIVAKVTTALINNVVGALGGDALLDGVYSAPCWLAGSEPWPASEILPTRNALLHLPSFAAGLTPHRIPPTPRFFCPYATDYDFDGSAPDPSNWLTFLHRLWPDEPDSITSLQEWFGYHLTPDTSQEKIGMFIGPKRSGKGTIAKALTAMIGEINVCNPKIGALGSPFGLESLIGKMAAIITDARITSRTDIAQVVESLLTISGTDRQTIARKHKTDWSGNLPTKFTIISNELPRLADASGALPGRMVIFQFKRSFYGEEDTNLFAGKIRPELPGILLWAVEGWKRLRDRGRLIQPTAGRQLVEEMEELSSPISVFLRERCIVEPGRQVLTTTLLEEWKRWGEAMGRKEHGDVMALGRNLRSVMPALETKQVRIGHGRGRFFMGIDLANPPTADAY